MILPHYSVGGLAKWIFMDPKLYNHSLNTGDTISLLLTEQQVLMHCIYQRVLERMSHLFNPLPDDKLLDWSKLKQIADDNIECI